MKRQTKKKTVKGLTKAQFTKTILSEIEVIGKSHPYHAFLLIASFNEYARVELGVNLFTNNIINKGLNYMTNHYIPMGLWLTPSSTSKRKHLCKYKGKTLLALDKVLNEIKTKLKKSKIDNTPFLNIK